MHKAPNVSNNPLELDKKLVFRAILCPITKNELNVLNCNSCPHCQKMKGKHHSGRSIKSLICIYNKDGENNDI